MTINVAVADWPNTVPGTATAASTTSAATLRTVWLSTVPMTADVAFRCLRRRLTSQVRTPSPTRPGATAEASTPIIVARTTPPTGTTSPGSAPRNVPNHANDRSTIDAQLRPSATATHAGTAAASELTSRREQATAV